MKYTTKLGLNKPDRTDYVLNEVLNENMDKIDTDLGHLKGSVAFSQNDKNKLDSAINYTHPATHSISIITETTDKKVMTAAERAKLEGIEAGANNYTHPASHNASMITQDSNRRFVTDAEKTKWNGYADIKNPIAISASSDLNNYKTPGWYSCTANATATTLSNMPPLKESFALEVISSNQVRQRWTHHNSERTFERSCYNNVWSAWKEVAYKGNLSKDDVGLGNLTNEKQATSAELQAHIKAQMPHEGTRTDGSRYRWGFKSDGGSLIYMEEDII